MAIAAALTTMRNGLGGREREIPVSAIALQERLNIRLPTRKSWTSNELGRFLLISKLPISLARAYRFGLAQSACIRL